MPFLWPVSALRAFRSLILRISVACRGTRLRARGRRLVEWSSCPLATAVLFWLLLCPPPGRVVTSAVLLRWFPVASSTNRTNAVAYDYMKLLHDVLQGRGLMRVSSTSWCWPAAFLFRTFWEVPEETPFLPFPASQRLPEFLGWQPTPVVLPGESHGQRSLVGYRPWGCKESDMTERLSTFILGISCWLSGKVSACQCGSLRFDPWVGKNPWRREWQPTPVFLLGESHGQRSLAGYSPWGHKESDMTE